MSPQIFRARSFVFRAQSLKTAGAAPWLCMLMLCWIVASPPDVAEGGQAAPAAVDDPTPNAGDENASPSPESSPPVIVLEPGQSLPPVVQLSPSDPVIAWDPDHVDDFQLVDQNNEPVTRASLAGRPWVANFIFARCIVQCPATCKKIMDLNAELRDVDVRFVTITVDPEHDTPEILHEFAEIWQADPARWLFVTGQPDEVWRLIRQGFKVSAWEEVGTRRVPGMEFAHNNHLIHVDAKGKIVGRYDSGIASELVTLKRVLRGSIETPQEHQPATRDQALAFARLMNGEVDEAGDPLEKLPDWVRPLPKVNAALNLLATVLLMLGYLAIKFAMVIRHRNLMLSAFAVSIIFLISYATYHAALHHYTGTHGKEFPGTGEIRTVYFAILISHVVLAAITPVLAIITIRNGLRGDWVPHRRWAKVTFPIWLYVSVTGVVIYWMLYEMPHG